MNGKAWETKVLEQFTQIEELELLEIAGSICTKLLYHMDQKKICIRAGEEEDDGLLRENIGKMAVILDALELRYEDTAESEYDFLKIIEASMQ